MVELLLTLVFLENQYCSRILSKFWKYSFASSFKPYFRSADCFGKRYLVFCLLHSISKPILAMFIELIAGMGTEIQSKMYLPGYYSIPTLTSNVGHGGWSLLNENKSLTNGQQYDILSMRPVVDGFHESSKEQVRQMILKHESIFKHQVYVLQPLFFVLSNFVYPQNSYLTLEHVYLSFCRSAQ